MNKSILSQFHQHYIISMYIILTQTCKILHHWYHTHTHIYVYIHILVRKLEGKRPLGRPRCRWVHNIRMYLQEVGCGYMDWIGLAQDKDRWRMLVSAVMNLRVPWNAGNFLTSCKPVSFSRRTLHHGVSKKVYIHIHTYCNLKYYCMFLRNFGVSSQTMGRL